MDQQSLYDILEATATDCILALSAEPAGSNSMDTDRLLRIFSSDARIRYGHKLFVSTVPSLQGEKTREEFLERLISMLPTFQTWSIATHGVIVDIPKRSAVVRADFRMSVKGYQEDPVPNEILFWIVMNESGKKVVEFTEFIDPMAGAEIVKKSQSNSKEE